MAKRRQPQPIPKAMAESRAAEVATVAWMFSAMTTLLCGGAAALVWLLAGRHGEGDPTMLLVQFLHFSAVVTAVASLALTGVVLKIRRVPPPRSITIAAVIVALLPILAAFL